MLQEYDRRIMPEPKTNEYTQQWVNVIAGCQEFILSTIKHRK